MVLRRITAHKKRVRACWRHTDPSAIFYSPYADEIVCESDLRPEIGFWSDTGGGGKISSTY